MVDLPKGRFYDEFRKLDEMHAKTRAKFLKDKGYEMPDDGPYRPSNSELIAHYEKFTQLEMLNRLNAKNSVRN